MRLSNSDTLFQVRDVVGAVRQEQLSAHQTITQTQSTIITQQTTMAETVRDTMTKISGDTHAIHDHTQSLREETRSMHDETRSVHETVRTTAANTETQFGELIRMIGQLAERFPELSLQHHTESRVVEEVDDSGQALNKMDCDEAKSDEELCRCIDGIINAIQDKEGVFGLAEVKDITDNLLVLLKAVSSDKSHYFLSSSSPETSNECELAELRRSLTAVQGMIMCSRSLLVNKRSERYWARQNA